MTNIKLNGISVSTCTYITSRILSSVQQTIRYGTRLPVGLRLNVIEVLRILATWR